MLSVSAVTLFTAAHDETHTHTHAHTLAAAKNSYYILLNRQREQTGGDG